MWFKILVDGTEIDIINASTPEEAIVIAKKLHGDYQAVWTTKRYG